MHRLGILALVSIPIVVATACSSGDRASSGGPPPGSDAGANEASTDASADAGITNLLDTLDPSKGPFEAELAKVSVLARAARDSGAGTADRVLIGGDPFLLATALDRVIHAASNDCVNSPFGCPTRTDADEVLGQFTASRSGLKTALVKALDVVDRYRWLAAAHTAIASANMLDAAGKLDPTARAALAPKITALASIATAFESYQFGAELPASFARVKALYLLTPGLDVPTAETAAAAKSVVLAVVPLLTAAGVKLGSFAPFSADGATPSGTSPALLMLQRATTLDLAPTPDATPVVEAYLSSLDAAALAALQGTEASIDWTGYAAALHGVDTLLDASLASIDLHVPAPTPTPPAGSAFQAPPTDRGTLENDPRVFRSQKFSPGTCSDSKGGKDTSTDQVYVMGPRLYGWDIAPTSITPRRVPPGTMLTLTATPLVKSAGTIPIPLSCDGTTVGWTGGLVRNAACGVPIDFTEPCFGKFGLDHFELVVRRASSGNIVLRHVYRAKPDGTTPIATWFLPRTDDPELAKDSVNAYFVSVTTVTQGGGSITRRRPVYWVEGTPATTDTKDVTAEPIDSPVDLLPEPKVPTGTFVVQKLGSALRIRPALQFVPRTPTSLTFVNETGVTIRVRSEFTPGSSDPAGLSSNAIGGVAALDTNDIADKASFTLATPVVALTSAPHRWAMGVVGKDPPLATIFAIEPP